MRWLVFAMMMTISSCGVTTPRGDGGAARDLAIAPDDLARRATLGISCGLSTMCTPTSQFCCTDDDGATGSCALNGAPCASIAFHCDGPEDCAPFLPECCMQGSSAGGGGIAQCQTSGYCATAATGQLMCHVDKDCGTTLKCCAGPGNSPYGFCQTSC